MQAPFGYAACFIPSIATLPRSASAINPTTNLPNAFGERHWPPPNGASIALWVKVERWGLDGHPVRLFTVFSPSPNEDELLALEVRRVHAVAAGPEGPAAAPTWSGVACVADPPDGVLPGAPNDRAYHLSAGPAQHGRLASPLPHA